MSVTELADARAAAPKTVRRWERLKWVDRFRALRYLSGLAAKLAAAHEQLKQVKHAFSRRFYPARGGAARRLPRAPEKVRHESCSRSEY